MIPYTIHTGAGLDLEPTPRARVEIAIGDRTLILSAFPWSARLLRAERMTLRAAAPPAEPPPPADDLFTRIADRGAEWSRRGTVPPVAEGPRVALVRATGGTPDACEWGFLEPGQAGRRASQAWMGGYNDGLHHLAEEVAVFAAAVVEHYLIPSPERAAKVRETGIRAAAQVVAIVRQVGA